MTAAADNDDLQSQEQGPRSDSLASSLFLLLVVTVGQRAIGLGRNILFCGFLEDEQLGRWSLSLNFLLLGAPLVVLGLPGSFGRYVEYYRQRGQLRPFLLRTTFVTLTATCAAVGAAFLWPRPLAHLLYGDPQYIYLVRLLALTLGFVVAINFLNELFTALRLVRYATFIQFLSSLLFAIVGVVILLGSDHREAGVMFAYTASTCAAVLVGVFLMFRVWNSLPENPQRLGQHDLWKRLVPFAGWVWLTNLIANLFDVADQFMLKHFSGLEATAADSLVGQYYSSRIVPLLLVSLVGMFAGSLVPHLTRDWEAGKRSLVREQIKLAVKLGFAFFTAAGALVLLFAPLLFGWALQGRYDSGLSILPGTLMYCVWYCVTCLAICYLYCAESARLASIAFGVGLIVNIGMNYLLVPHWGLVGVVAATCAANAVALGLACLLCTWHGMRWDRGVWLASTLPVCLLLGGVEAGGVYLIMLMVFARRIFDEEERRTLSSLVLDATDRIAQHVPQLSRWIPERTA